MEAVAVELRVCVVPICVPLEKNMTVPVGVPLPFFDVIAVVTVRVTGEVLETLLPLQFEPPVETLTVATDAVAYGRHGCPSV